jgi:hypothetical protein
MTQKAKGQAATAIAPDHGSNIPREETKMNSTEHSIGQAVAPEPLLQTIRLYQRGLAEFNFRTFDVEDDEWDDLVRVTYGPHLEALTGWDEAAVTAEGAMEALRIALKDDGGVYGSDAADSMVRAAYGYLKGVTA